MCNNYDTKYDSPLNRLKSFHKTETYKKYVQLAKNGYTYEENSRASCHFCGVHIDIEEYVNQDRMNLHSAGCPHDKRRGPEVLAESRPDGAEDRYQGIQEGEESLHNPEEVFQHLNPSADSNPVVDLRERVVHLASETMTSRNPSDGSIEAPLAVDQVVPTENAATQAHPAPNPAGSQPEEISGTSQLCL